MINKKLYMLKIKLLFEHFVIFILRAYQMFLSPFLMPACRFYPSCSNYAICAVENHGVFKGLYFSVKRIFKCHPFHNKTGYDPVP